MVPLQANENAAAEQYATWNECFDTMAKMGRAHRNLVLFYMGIRNTSEFFVPLCSKGKQKPGPWRKNGGGDGAAARKKDMRLV